jgi:chemotaxis protein MotA
MNQPSAPQRQRRIPAALLTVALTGLAVMLVGAYLEGAPMAGFLNLPALLIVGAGTFAATMAASGPARFFRSFSAYRRGLREPQPPWVDGAREIIHAAGILRGPGIRALEDHAEEIRERDEFFAQGLQLVADQADEDQLVEILEAAAMSEQEQLLADADIFERAGGYAPTMGIIGTVMGLTHALGMLDHPDQLGPAIASAFMATLYGVGSANLLLLPAGQRLEALAHDQLTYRRMQIAGLSAVLAGEGTRILADRLVALMPPGTATAERLLGDDTPTDREGQVSGKAQEDGAPTQA